MSEFTNNQEIEIRQEVDSFDRIRFWIIAGTAIALMMTGIGFCISTFSTIQEAVTSPEILEKYVTAWHNILESVGGENVKQSFDLFFYQILYANPYIFLGVMALLLVHISIKLVTVGFQMMVSVRPKRDKRGGE